MGGQAFAWSLSIAPKLVLGLLALGFFLWVWRRQESSRVE
jgi:hypothetical protein